MFEYVLEGEKLLSIVKDKLYLMSINMSQKSARYMKVSLSKYVRSKPRWPFTVPFTSDAKPNNIHV